jgi:hypothetical protein
MIKYPLSVICFSVILFYNYFDTGYSGEKHVHTVQSNILSSNNHSDLRDTVYTLKQHFIVVDLSSQMGYLYSRNKPVKEFGISSGTKRILDGVETNEGLFVIQSMMKRWHSRQFDSTLMLNWMGFNYGIGFHALAGNSYYKYLGTKKSSHGCVRISKEDAKEIYSKVESGTPVLVHNGNNAVFIGFADSNQVFSEYSYTQLLEILPSRYEKIYTGKYFIEPSPKILIDKHNIHHPGLPIGDSQKIPPKQIILPDSFNYVYAQQDRLKLNVTGF